MAKIHNEVQKEQVALRLARGGSAGWAEAHAIPERTAAIWSGSPKVRDRGFPRGAAGGAIGTTGTIGSGQSLKLTVRRREAPIRGRGRSLRRPRPGPAARPTGRRETGDIDPAHALMVTARRLPPRTAPRTTESITGTNPGPMTHRGSCKYLIFYTPPPPPPPPSLSPPPPPLSGPHPPEIRLTRSASRAASIVRSMSSSVCAAETNAASNWLHGR